MISGVINKGQAPNSLLGSERVKYQEAPELQEKAFRGLKQDLPGGENTECSSFSGCGNARLLWTVLLCRFPPDVALGLVQRCDWSYLPRHTLGWLGAGKINNLPERVVKGRPLCSHYPLPITPACNPSLDLSFMQMLLYKQEQHVLNAEHNWALLCTHYFSHLILTVDMK